MSDNSADIQAKFENFIQVIGRNKEVYGLESAEGFATSSSNEFEGENGEPIELLCFWSEAALAQQCAKEDWAGFTPAAIPLAEFMENWLIGLHNDEVLVGVEFDNEFFGFEVEPIELLQQIILELRNNGQEISFENHESLDDLEDYIKEALEGEEE